MFKYKIVFLFFFCTCFSFAQNDTSQLKGTIKIAKHKDGEIYVKATVNFNVYLPIQQNKGNSYGDFVKSMEQLKPLPANTSKEPVPIVTGFSNPFDYDDFFNKSIGKKEINLGERETDTVRIKIDILSDGKYYYRDLTTMMKVSKTVVSYDKKLNAFRVLETHFKSMDVLKSIIKWNVATTKVLRGPHSLSIGKNGGIRFGKQKLVDRPVNASGILTIIFSSTPF